MSDHLIVECSSGDGNSLDLEWTDSGVLTLVAYDGDLYVDVDLDDDAQVQLRAFLLRKPVP